MTGAYTGTTVNREGHFRLSELCEGSGEIHFGILYEDPRHIFPDVTRDRDQVRFKRVLSTAVSIPNNKKSVIIDAEGKLLDYRVSVKSTDELSNSPGFIRDATVHEWVSIGKEDQPWRSFAGLFKSHDFWSPVGALSEVHNCIRFPSPNPVAWLAITHPNFATFVFKVDAKRLDSNRVRYYPSGNSCCCDVAVILPPAPVVTVKIAQTGLLQIDLECHSCDPSEYIPVESPLPLTLNSRFYRLICDRLECHTTVQIPAAGKYLVKADLWQDGLRVGSWVFTRLPLSGGSVLDLSKP
jgi:hypothetical protein